MVDWEYPPIELFCTFGGGNHARTFNVGQDRDIARYGPNQRRNAVKAVAATEELQITGLEVDGFYPV